MDKKQICIIVSVLAVVALIFAGWALHSYYDSGDSHDVGGSIQSVENAGQRAGTAVTDAQRELGDGQEAACRIEGRLEQLEAGADERSELIVDCERIISNIEQLFADIDERNSADGKHE